ncbi:signal recognition particle receptor subunit beta [Galendromus occidentalis]|uniref:Signal recognition particle receptor subunit beta n=1 Tax=Galendromus occidentalis TaxID=34638 RepID=A0AAJ6QPB3_9ACAR|nr:signal recognition particle receptor subunit beta [Galendromus occidentalis]
MDVLGSEATVLSVVLALLIVVITVVFVLRRSRGGRSNVLICGISNAGKTVLYAHLCSGKTVQTYVSIKENQGQFEHPSSGKVVKLVDIPGNERQRMNVFDNFKSSARALIFVVDSISFMSELKDVAEYAYYVLSDPDTSRLPVLIACNKQDDSMAKSITVIKSNLEKELNLLRKTQSSKLVTTEGAQLGRVLGSARKDFEFADLSQTVDFVEFSSTADRTPVLDWLSKL